MYEARYNSANHRIILEAGTKRSTFTFKERNHESALILTRYYDSHKELEYTEMEVHSPYIQEALRTVIKKYPGLTFDNAKIVIRDEPRCIFHYRNEIRDYGMGLVNQTAVQHLVFFLNYMYDSLTREISAYYAFMESPTCAPGIEHDLLWMAFKPGELIYHMKDGIHIVMKFTSMRRTHPSRWLLNAEAITYNGDVFGYTEHFLSVPWYDGYEPLEELSVFPLRHHSNKEEIQEALVARGRKYVNLRNTCQRYYSGIAESLSRFRPNSGREESDHYSIQSTMIKGPEIDYDTRAFKSLVLAEGQKRMILSLVKVHSQNELQFDDLIKGKGKGIIFLLHGEPGVGKTLTAESIAVYTKRPLYTVSSGDLGVSAPECERALIDILGLATCWNAILLLIDEADVFLEQQSNHDLKRNDLVSVFLRLLEYYEGIMFLTSNRMKAFDTAFKSRIHLAINYPRLSGPSQRELWLTFLTNDSQRSTPSWLTESTLQDLTEKGLNGR
ncbi:P-loop containing nucleoside triphosphate hydrolase protein [Mytilinidion resinicola]|uniref:P-loop containing nucleoside triphosphate hydrolase protein n=1 Tax=Mytilinidion resinicola TaxID=574789 RepID=A0A6A6Z8T7_9PEZI|nr:P-loop containing nucleoside triphosphate hydrolase protein [Mytilinidion resinicola]KAF2817426.1 P-loop containing nucleoside triphosphate hydrolase protein [Mytilinidion resinicola]